MPEDTPLDWLNTAKPSDYGFTLFDLGPDAAPISERVYYDNGDIVEWPTIITEDENLPPTTSSEK